MRHAGRPCPKCRKGSILTDCCLACGFSPPEVIPESIQKTIVDDNRRRLRNPPERKPRVVTSAFFDSESESSRLSGNIDSESMTSDTKRRRSAELHELVTQAIHKEMAT